MTRAQPPVRILLVDDHVLFRQGLRMLLENAGAFAVVGEAASCAEAVDCATSLRPDIVLLGLDLAEESGLDCIAPLASLHPSPRVVVLTGARDVERYRSAIRLGAAGIVQKQQPSDTLIKAIQRVSDGELWLDRTLAAAIFGALRHDGAGTQGRYADAARIAELTQRERQIVALVAEGTNTLAIGQHLEISEKTVRNHLAAIYDKLLVHDRLALALYAARHGLTYAPK